VCVFRVCVFVCFFVCVFRVFFVRFLLIFGRRLDKLARAEASLRQVSQAATHERSKRQQLEAEVSELRQTHSQQSQEQTASDGTFSGEHIYVI